MLIRYDPDEYQTVSQYHTCEFHKRYPGEPFAGCTCSGSLMSRRRTLDEIEAVKADKRRKEEDRILAQAEVIRARRALEGSDHG